MNDNSFRWRNTTSKKMQIYIFFSDWQPPIWKKRSFDATGLVPIRKNRTKEHPSDPLSSKQRRRLFSTENKNRSMEKLKKNCNNWNKMLSHNVYNGEKNQKKFEKPPVDKKNTQKHIYLVSNYLQNYPILQFDTKRINLQKKSILREKKLSHNKKKYYFCKVIHV